MFGFLKRHDPAKEAAEMAATLAGAVIEFAGWPEEMTSARLLATAVLTVWGAQVMWDPDIGFVGEEALKIRFRHRTPEAAKALHDNAMLLYEKLKFGPLHDRCCHKYARSILERDTTHLQDLARDTLPELEAEATAALSDN